MEYQTAKQDSDIKNQLHQQDKSNNQSMQDQGQDYSYTFYADGIKNDNKKQIKYKQNIEQKESQQLITSSEKKNKKYQLSLLHQARDIGSVDDQKSSQQIILEDGADNNNGMIFKLNDEAFLQQNPNDKLNNFIKNGNNSEIYSELKLAEENLQFQKQSHHKHTNSRLSAFSYNDYSRSSSTIITLTSSIIQPQPFHPQFLQCPHCCHSGMSLVKRKNGKHAFSVAGACCLVGCWAGCQCIPLVCTDKFKEYRHYCRECGEVITKYNPF